jgi:uncharacterized protein
MVRTEWFGAVVMQRLEQQPEYVNMQRPDDDSPQPAGPPCGIAIVPGGGGGRRLPRRPACDGTTIGYGATMKIAVTGSTGLIGSALVPALRSDGHTIVRVVRGGGDGDDVVWDPRAATIAQAGLAGIDALVHLAGAGIGDHRWTPEYKKEIEQSRLLGTGLISTAIAKLDVRPKVMISASAIGFYGARGDELLDESSAPGAGFLSKVCLDWEAATAPAAEAGISVATIRTGIVLSRHGGALKKMLPLFKLGLGGRFGNGRQWLSWISIGDEIGAIRHLLSHPTSGPVNLTAPNPVTASQFATTLGKVLHRPSFLPVPSFGPKLLVGSEAAEALLFTGQRVLPKVLLASGYEFAAPEVAGALATLLNTG